jgi:phosphoribosylformylglycinamidine synthase
MPPRVLVLRSPGTNCDVETAFAFERAGATTERVHINRLLENPARFRDFQILVVPGGFSYGDDLAAGRILGNQIRHHLAEQLAEFKAAGKLILGICNGFQVLIKSPGILLDDDAQVGSPATLTWNESGRFEDRWVNLRVCGDKCVFTRGLESLYLPVAHAEGKFVPGSQDVLQKLDANGQLNLRYQTTVSETQNVPYPENPNGATMHVAGVCDSTGCVFGLMPHPERHIDPTQHPRWTRGPIPAEGAGLAIFRNAVQYFG